LISLALLVFFRQLADQPYYKAYLLSLLVSFIFAGGSELLQMLTPNRAAELIDFINDMLGSISFLLLYALFDPRLRQHPLQRQWKMRLAAMLLILLCWLSAIIPVSQAAWLHWSRQAAFPELFIPGDNQLTTFMARKGSHYDFIMSPQQGADHAKLVTRWHTNTDSNWPFLRLQNIIHDWSGYQELRVVIEQDEPLPTTLQIRIDDRHYDGRNRHTLSRTFILRQGNNILDVPFAQHEVLDLQHITHVWLALPRPLQQHTLLIHSIRLRRPGTHGA
jgi:hypothetical protein